MNILSIFGSGALVYVLTGIFLLLEGWFVYQLATHSKRDGIKWYKSPFKWYILFTLAAYIVVLLVIASDYKGVK